MPKPAACWACAVIHREPQAIYVCQYCHMALCAGSVFVQVGQFPYAHLVDNVYCGPVVFIGQADSVLGVLVL